MRNMGRYVDQRGKELATLYAVTHDGTQQKYEGLSDIGAHIKVLAYNSREFFFLGSKP
jgi:hypothetical protein